MPERAELAKEITVPPAHRRPAAAAAATATRDPVALAQLFVPSERTAV